MANPQRYTVPATTIANGSATVYTPDVHGKISRIVYTKTDFADGVDFAITTEKTLQEVITDANVNLGMEWLPRKVVNLNSSGAEVDAWGDIYAVRERIKIAITNGGDTKSGSFEVVVV